MIQFEQIDERLKRLGKDRKWLSEVTPYSQDYIRTVLAPNSTRRTERVMNILSNAIEREEESAKVKTPDPDRITLDAPADELRVWNQAALASGKIVHEWAVEQLNLVAKAWKEQAKEAKRPLRYPTHEDGPNDNRLAEDCCDLPFFGLVAAGNPGGPVDVADGTVRLAQDYDPATHYVLRVSGRSMEPDYADGSLIVCRKLRDGEFAKKGQDVIGADASGAYFKRLVYTKEGPKGNGPRKAVPRLMSINPEFPEVVPLGELPIVAVVVGKV